MTRTDKELMQVHDGEGNGQASAELSLAEEKKLEALAQVGDAMRVYVDAETEARGAQLDSMWWRLEEQLDAADRSKQSPKGRSSSLWRGPWGYLGAAFAGAVAAAFFFLLADETGPQVVERTVFVPAPAAGPEDSARFAAQQAEPTTVEELEVSNGVGTVMQVTANEGEVPTTVIWVRHNPMLEDPI